MTEGLKGDTPYERAKSLMSRLRAECPWDSAQTFETIAPYTIEEAYEVSETIAQKDWTALKSELGDLLFQVLFHSILAEEIDAFNLDDVCETLIAKMVSRHPHVFRTATAASTADLQQVGWEEIKARERQAKACGKTSLLDDVPLALPELMRAEKLQKRAARVGFDWPDISGVTDKIAEEAQEVADALLTGKHDAVEDEIGDLLFAVTNLARHAGVDPEVALRRTNAKFTRRFQHIENESPRPLVDMSLDEMEALWIAAKRIERS